MDPGAQAEGGNDDSDQNASRMIDQTNDTNDTNTNNYNGNNSNNNNNNNNARPHDQAPHQHDNNAYAATENRQTQPSQARVVGGFAAMVDAFMSSFRQASMAQNQNNQSQAQRSSNHQEQQGVAVPPPPTPSSQAAPTDTRHPIDTIPSQEEAIINPAPSADPEMVPSAIDSDSSNDQQQQQPTTTQNNETRLPNQNSTTEANSEAETPRILYFRMPFLTNDGQSATLAFTPGPIPIPPQRPEPRPAYGPERPAHYGPERGNGRASGFHLPTAPIFVPLGASPLPFSFIFDMQTNTAWPIGAVSGPPGSMPVNDTEAGFVAGPPFHVGLNISFGPPPEPEIPDPERAMRFVDSLERADAELRERMAQLGMGSIGDYGNRQENEGGEGALGCGICLDEYPSEDRPEWIGGQASKDEEVVAVPCAGHHTLHRICLYEWLAKTPPSEWTCPFCRAGLDKKKVEKSAQTERSTQTNVVVSDDVIKKAQQEAKARSLREEVRLREKARGWRCDSPACLPRYPDNNGEDTSGSLVSLLPCRHKLHLDCLCTSMRLEQADIVVSSDQDDEEVEEVEEEEEEEEAAIMSAGLCAAEELLDDSSIKNTVGKWVTCPTCRVEAWAELPIKKRSRRIVKAALASQVPSPSVVGKTMTNRAGLSNKEESLLDQPIYDAQERARLQKDMQTSLEQNHCLDNDSDGDVEALLY